VEKNDEDLREVKLRLPRTFYQALKQVSSREAQPMTGWIKGRIWPHLEKEIERTEIGKRK